MSMTIVSGKRITGLPLEMDISWIDYLRILNTCMIAIIRK